jgi:hypothetical protein
MRFGKIALHITGDDFVIFINKDICMKFKEFLEENSMTKD